MITNQIFSAAGDGAAGDGAGSGQPLPGAQRRPGRLGQMGQVRITHHRVQGWIYSISNVSRYISPQYWMSFPIISGEISNVKTFHCPHNPMITDDKTGIIKQVIIIYYLLL